MVGSRDSQLVKLLNIDLFSLCTFTTCVHPQKLLWNSFWVDLFFCLQLTSWLIFVISPMEIMFQVSKVSQAPVHWWAGWTTKIKFIDNVWRSFNFWHQKTSIRFPLMCLGYIPKYPQCDATYRFETWGILSWNMYSILMCSVQRAIRGYNQPCMIVLTLDTRSQHLSTRCDLKVSILCQ